MTIVSLLLDVLLIGLLIAGIAYAVKLTRQLAEMRASRAEMENFVLSFNATVSRAEAGIRGLKAASRSAGDDLERLIERGQGLRDELHFLIESADQIASRLSDKAGAAARSQTPPAAKPTEPAVKPPASPAFDSAAASSAERELMRALKKIG